MSDATLAALSNHLVNSCVAVYALAMFGYAAELAFGGHIDRRVAARTIRRAAQREPALVGAGVSVGAPALPAQPARSAEITIDGVDGVEGADGADGPGERGWRRPGLAAQIGGAALALTVLGWLLQAGGIAARGLSAHRLPWGNMYEFTLGLTFAAVTAFLIINMRQRIGHLGLFVMLPVVLGIGVAISVLYVPSSPLMPALHSYWLAIHVTAMMVASGVFTVGTAAATLQLVSDHHARRTAAGKPVRLSRFVRLLPSSDALDRTAYRSLAFGFPVWTFAVIAGAIWAEAAWGHYWQWDPKETWAFITWIAYAGYLHARATAGWRGRKASYVALIGYATFLFSFFGVNIFITGLHSYAGL